MNKFRIAVVGNSPSAHQYIERIIRHPHCELAAIVEPSKPALVLACHLQVAWFPSLNELLNSDKPDAVIVCSATEQHLQQAIFCIVARVPVMLSAPLVSSLDAARELQHALDCLPSICLMAKPLQYNDRLQAFRQQLADPTAGQLMSIEGILNIRRQPLPFWAAKHNPNTWLTDDESLISLLPQLWILQAVAGDIHKIAAVPDGVRPANGPYSPTIELEFANGIQGRFRLNSSALISNLTGTPASDPDDDGLTEFADFSFHTNTGTLQLHTNGTAFRCHLPIGQPNIHANNRPSGTDCLSAQLEHFYLLLCRRQPESRSVAEFIQQLELAKQIFQAMAGKYPALHLPVTHDLPVLTDTL
ncbi:Gfo/Idh/MocA family protein [Oceanobacter mangrovi]|uniref:Gfo/Idh/MocA family protein n=1 Tax=Oceanobacter mangrovi TaxID=2862510 RepID=UPI001C8E7DFB|nr:Gfo/Idh/MocA family oxidoreductase [Oceanobacter mangrovi]